MVLHTSLLHTCPPRPWHQVVLTLAGDVTRHGSTVFQCPLASYFFDEFRGLYSNGSYQVWFSDIAGLAPCLHRVSSLQFQCMSCAVGTYSRLAGYSTGDLGTSPRELCAPTVNASVCGGGSWRLAG